MRMMKKAMLALLAAMLVAVVAGCGGNGNGNGGNASDSGTPAGGADASAPSGQKGGEPVAVKYVVPGDKPNDYDEIIGEVNNKLIADGIGVQIDVQYIPWSAWEQKTNLMLSTGEHFDLFQIMQDVTPFSTYFAKGALMDITQYIDQYGPNLKRYIPQQTWDGAVIKGKTYTIPTYWLEGGRNGNITIRKDLLDANGLSVPTDGDELLNAWKTVAANWKGARPPYLPLAATNFDEHWLDFLHRGYADYPFTVMEKMFYVNQDGTIKPWVESDAFKQDSAWFRQAYEAHLIDPDVLVAKPEQRTTMENSGDWFLELGVYQGSMEDLRKNYPDLKESDVYTYDLFPDAQDLRTQSIKNSNGIPTTSEHPAEAIRFLNWLYDSQDNYDLFMYGVQGKTWNTSGGQTYEPVLDPKTNVPIYNQADWMIGNLKYLRYSDRMLDVTTKSLYTVDEKAVNSIAAAFFFDAAPVKAQYAAVLSAYQANMLPILLGVQDYDKAYPAALQKMKDAGLDDVVAEYTKQFAAYRAETE